MSTLKFLVTKDEYHRGNINAPIALVEYGDYQCPYCKRAHPLVKRLLKESGDQFYFVFRNFPLRKVHPLAQSSAISAEAAGKQGKFWEMHDLIFENQPKLTTRFLLSLAEGLGLDPVQFERDSKSEALLNKIETDFEGGMRSGVNRTPTFFLNGSRLIGYDETYKSLADAILIPSEMLAH